MGNCSAFGLAGLSFISCALFGGDAPKADAPAPRKLSVAVSNLPNETPPSKDAMIFMTQFHQINYHAFTRINDRFGELRTPMIRAMHHGFVQFEENGFNQLSLIGLLGKEPMAYSQYRVFFTAEGKGWGDEKNAKRALADFEKRALVEIKKGRDVVVELENPRNPAPRELPNKLMQDSGAAVYAVGAIHAKKSCLECHEVKEGAVLGALSYRIASKFIERSVPELIKAKQAAEQDATK